MKDTTMPKYNQGQFVRRCEVHFIMVLLAMFLITEISPAQTPLTWKSVIVGGGGFVPGIIYHPSKQGLVYARTDMGGAYRWDNTAGRWIPLTDMMDRTNSDYMGILSIALDPADTNRVYLMCGKYIQSWAGLGAVLVSTNQGNSWTIVPLSVKVGGNEDGRGAGERLQVDPNLSSTLFMGTNTNGLWKSIDYAASWTYVPSFSPSVINFVLIDPKSDSAGIGSRRIFVGVSNTSGQTLYRSDDGGTTWSPAAGQPSGLMAVRAALADTTLYITYANVSGPNGAASGAVWKYYIQSGIWTNITPSAGSYGFSGVSVYPKNPKIVIVSTLDRWSPQDEVYLTTDGGSTWSTRLTTGTLDYSFAPYTSSGGLKPHWLGCLSMDPFDSSKAMFGTGYGIWASDNITASTPGWYFKDNNLEETVPMQLISPSFTNLLSAMGDYDGFRHDDLDVSPRQGRFSPVEGTTLSLAYAGIVPSKIVKAFNASPYASYSTDGGTTWRNFRTSRGLASYPSGATAGGTWSIALSADGNTVVWGPTGASLSYTKNLGKTWTTCGGGVPLIPPVADRVNPNIFYAYDGSAGQMWVSSDGGQTFNKGAGGLPVPSNTQDGNATAVPGYEGRVWICCGEGGLYRSANSGQSASKVSTVTAAYRLGFGKPQPQEVFPSIFLYGIVNGTLGIFRSDDYTVTWTRINDDNHQFGWIHQISGDLRVYGRCYVSAEGRGIQYSDIVASDTTINPKTFNFAPGPADSLSNISQLLTLSWTRSSDSRGSLMTYILHFFGPGIDTTLSSTDTSIVFSAGNIQGASLYTLTGIVTNGFDTTASANSLSMYTAAALTSVNRLPANSVKGFALYQNYPNPFNPLTTISYSLPKESTVTLNVYDIAGRRVASLIHDGKESAGNHMVLFSTTNLASGVYFYKLLADDFTETRKLVLLK